MNDKIVQEIREHARYWDCYNDAPLTYNHTGKLVKIAENFAIRYSIWKEDYLKNNDVLTDKELMIIFRKNHY